MTTTERLNSISRRLARRPLFVASGALWLGLAAVLFAWPGRFSLAAVAEACGVPAPDVAFAPSVAETTAFVEGCGESGLVAYRDLQIVDLLYPAAGALFLMVVLAFLLQRIMPRAAWLALLPLAAALGDYLENAAAWVLITVGPGEALWAASVLQAGSAVKVVLSWGSWLLVTGLLVALAARAVSARGASSTQAVGLGGEVIGHLLAGPAQGRELAGRELVDEVLAHAGHVIRGGSHERVPARLRQGGEGASAVILAGLALDQIGLLHPIDLMGQAASRGERGLGESAHPQLAVGGFGEADENLVVRHRESVLGLQVAVQPILKKE